MSWVQEVFLPKYKQQLNGIPERNRGDGFEVIFNYLENLNYDRYHIIETGSMRPNGSLEGDGQSTRLFDEFINYHDGELISIDIDEDTSRYAYDRVSSKTMIINSNSIPYLWEYHDDICLLYLDSYDVDFNNPINSNLHHLKELTAAASMLKSDILVAVDDCRFFDGDKRVPFNVKASDVGKGNFVESFMKDINATKLFDGYQKIWKI